MEYKPITDDQKQNWINWLNSQVTALSNKREDGAGNKVFETPEGDVATGKDLVGNLLALLTGKTVIIPIILALLLVSCRQADRHERQWSDNGKDSVVYVQAYDNNGNMMQYYMNYLLFQSLFNSGGYNACHSYYRSHPGEFTTQYRYTSYRSRDAQPTASATTSKSSSYSSPSRSSSSSSSSYSTPKSYSSPSRSSSSSSSYSSPSRSSSYSSPSRSYSSPSRSYSSPSRSYSSPSRGH